MPYKKLKSIFSKFKKLYHFDVDAANEHFDAFDRLYWDAFSQNKKDLENFISLMLKNFKYNYKTFSQYDESISGEDIIKLRYFFKHFTGLKKIFGRPESNLDINSPFIDDLGDLNTFMDFLHSVANANPEDKDYRYTLEFKKCFDESNANKTLLADLIFVTKDESLIYPTHEYELQYIHLKCLDIFYSILRYLYQSYLDDRLLLDPKTVLVKCYEHMCEAYSLLETTSEHFAKTMDTACKNHFHREHKIKFLL